MVLKRLLEIRRKTASIPIDVHESVSKGIFSVFREKDRNLKTLDQITKANLPKTERELE